MNGHLFDFNRPIGRPCKDCGYPSRSGPDSLYKLKIIDCPDHMPQHWKFHENEAFKIAKAVDKAEEEMNNATRTR